MIRLLHGLAMLIAVLSLASLMDLTVLSAGSNVAVYHTVFLPMNFVSILDSNHVVAVSSNYLIALNPVNGSVLYYYALFGAPTRFAADRAFAPHFIAVATNRGEIAVFRASATGKLVKVSALRLHGTYSILKLYVYKDLVYALTQTPYSTKLIVLNSTRTSWCELGAPPSNMVITRWSYARIIDVIDALRGSNGSLASSSLLVLSYTYTAPYYTKIFRNAVMMLVKVLIGNRSVPNAIVIIKFDHQYIHLNTNSEGLVRTYIPRNVTRITIQAYFVNKSTGQTYYGEKHLVGPISTNTSSYYIVLHLQPKSVVVPQLYSKVWVSVVNVSSDECSRIPVLINIPFNVTSPHDLVILGAYLRGSELVLIYGLRNRTVVGSAWSINIAAISLKTGKTIALSYYYTLSKPVYASISADGRLICVVTENNILYVAWSPDLVRYRMIDNLVLPSAVTNIAVEQALGSYMIIVGCKDGSFIVLRYVVGSPIQPVNRGRTLYLRLAPPTYVSSSPDGNIIAVATLRGLYYIENLGSNLRRVIGKNLEYFVTRNIEVLVKAKAMSVTMLLNSSSMYVAHGVHAVFRNVPPGSHELVISPSNPFAPKVVAHIDIKGMNVRFKIRFLNPFTNRSMQFSAVEVRGNKSILISSNTTYLYVSISNKSSEAKYVIRFLPMHVDGYEFQVYTNATLLIRVEYNKLYIELSLPTWIRASRVELCLVTPYGRSVSNASIYIKGILTNYTTKLMFDPRTRCFEAYNVPYDVYRVIYVALPPTLEPPRAHTIIVSQNVVVSRQIALLRPVTIRVVFSEPPRVPLEIVVGGKRVIVEKGMQSVVISGIEPGRYTVRVIPGKLITTFGGRIAVPYYENVTMQIDVRNNMTLRIPLKQACIYVRIDVRDSLNRKSGPIIPVRLLINGVYVKTLTSKDHVVSGFIPARGTTTVTIVPLQQVYQRVVKVLNPQKSRLANNSVVTIYVPRKIVDVTLIVASNLGKRVSGALVIPTCEYGTPSPTVTDNEGKATFRVPAYTRCTVKVLKEGYEQVIKPIFVGTSSVYETVMLRAKPLTVVMQYMNVLLAGSIIGVVIGVMLYLKKRIEAKLAMTSEEIF